MTTASFFPRALSVAVVAALFAVTATSTRAYLLLENAWPSGSIPMTLQLDATKPTNVTLPLTDGSTSWNAMAATIFADWNANLGRSQFTFKESTSTVASYNGDTTNNVLFATKTYDSSFGPFDLAVTLSDSTPVRKSQADVLVNKAGFTFNSYRGTLRTSGAVDLRRVLLHEFGHVLGLDHPDQASPVQSIAAIMNSVVSNTETLQLDDINGVKFLYSAIVPKANLTTQPTDLTVSATGSTSFSVAVDGKSSVTGDSLHGYAWYFAPTGSTTFEPLPTFQNSTKVDFLLVQPSDAGRYYFSAFTPDVKDTVNSNTVTLTVNPVALSPTTQLVNVATRGVAGSGANSMIVGITISGSKPKRVLIRAVGPTLINFGVPGVLADPILTLKNSAGTDLASNDDWGTPFGAGAAAATDISATSVKTGAFALAAGSKDAVILTTLAPGGYTALVTSKNASSGVVLLEAYDADDPKDPAIKLANLSTRGFVGTGGDIIIAGFVVNGPGPKTYLIRAIGPTLLDFGLPGALLDPYLKLFRGDGTLVRENDDWDAPAALMDGLRAASVRAGAFALRETRIGATGMDSVMLVTLPPGSYSAQMSGFDDATGIGLIEVYEMSN